MTVCAVMAMYAMTACTGGIWQFLAPATPSGSPIDAPQGALSSPVWLADGWIYVLRDDPTLGPREEVWRTRQAGKAERLNLPDQPGCRVTGYQRLQALPDGRLGIERLCLMEDPRQDYFDLVAYEPSTAKVEPLVRLSNMANQVTWAPGLQEGYVSHSDAICVGIARFTRNGAERIPDPVTFDGHRWVIDSAWFSEAAADCTADGQANLPVLRKDGKSLLIFASPTSQGESGGSRTRHPWNLYRWTPGVDQPRSVVKGFGPPLAAVITPDDRSLLVATQWKSQDGIWRVDLQSGEVTSVSAGKGLGVTVSPDGKKIAAVFESGDTEHTRLRVIDAA